MKNICAHFQAAVFVLIAGVMSTTPSFANESLTAISDFVLPIGHGKSGKWYAEVTVEAALAKQMASSQFKLGIDNVNTFFAVTGGVLEEDEKSNVFGLALDLDARTFNWRDNTSRLLSGDGAPLKPNDKPYGIRVSLDKNLATLLKYGAVQINYGQAPFKFPMPAGYSPWHYARDSNDVATWLVPAYEKVADKDPRGLAEVFWQWLTSLPPSKNPALDRSGQFCSEGQQGSLWFLSGAAAADRIERTCTVPFGTNIVVPVISAKFPSKDLATCKETTKLTKLSPYSLHETFIEINGVRFDRLQGYAASFSDCGESTEEGKPVAKNPVWLGMWVPLRPLPRGEHTIRFGGRINALNVERQVTYKIAVK